MFITVIEICISKQFCFTVEKAKYFRFEVSWTRNEIFSLLSWIAQHDSRSELWQQCPTFYFTLSSFVLFFRRYKVLIKLSFDIRLQSQFAKEKYHFTSIVLDAPGIVIASHQLYIGWKQHFLTFYEASSEKLLPFRQITSDSLSTDSINFQRGIFCAFVSSTMLSSKQETGN